MAAENPDVQIIPPDVWTKIATAVQRGFIHILAGETVYYQSHRLTGDAKPDDEILPGTPDFEGVAMYYRIDRFAGEFEVVGGDAINSTVPRDIYVYCKTNPGRIRYDQGEDPS